jgi:Group II intron, maturase-specific domain
MVEKVRAMTERKTSWQETTEVVGKLNRSFRGWANYFKVGSDSDAYRALDNYTAPRLRRWLRLKYKSRNTNGGSYPLSLDLTRFRRHISTSSTKLLKCQRAQKAQMNSSKRKFIAFGIGIRRPIGCQLPVVWK